MKTKAIVVKKMNLSDEQASKLIVLRCGGWLKDQINPAEWPGGLKAPRFEAFDPEFLTVAHKGYVEFCFTDDLDRQRIDFEMSELV